MSRLLIVVPLFLMLAACTVGTRYVPPPTVHAEEQAWIEPVSTAEVDATWWSTLGDPMLNDLINSAVSGNLDLRQADARLREARANRDAAAGGRWPQVNATASVTTNELSSNGVFPIQNIPRFNRRYGLFDGGFDASWEIDLWGRIAAQVEAAQARAAAADELRRDTLLQTIAEVVRAYVDLRSAQSRLASATADADDRAQIAILVAQRFSLGEASRLDDARAEQQALSVLSDLAGISSEVREATYRLALLTGQPPEALSSLAQEPQPLPNPPAQVGAGLRSDLLRRRPDIRSAERELAAATADSNAATAELFPRVTLIGSIGQQSQHPGDLSSSLSTRYQLGPSFSWPVLSFGRIRAQVRAANARADAAGAVYEKALLTALADSETALNRYAAAASQRHDRDAARAQSATELELTRQRYARGEDSLITLLSAQSQLSAATQAALSARAAELTALISLYKALGGGWEYFDSPHG